MSYNKNADVLFNYFDDQLIYGVLLPLKND